MVTVCYNCVNEIEDTILSVVHQSAFDNLEYIVVDGKSKDGTCDVISKYEDKIDTIISEPDKGVYDAMNKGIIASNGDFIIFMNAGDFFYEELTCEKVLTHIETDGSIADVYYGDVVRRKRDKMELSPAESLSLLRYRMPFSHQSCFIKNSIMKEYMYDTRYKIAADFNLFHILYVKGNVFSHINYIISIYEAENGVSATNYLASIREVSRVIVSSKAKTWFYDMIANLIRGHLIWIIKQFRR